MDTSELANSLAEVIRDNPGSDVHAIDKLWGLRTGGALGFWLTNLVLEGVIRREPESEDGSVPVRYYPITRETTHVVNDS